MTPLEEFWSLCKQAEDAYGSPESTGTPDLEPFGLRILELVRAHPELRTEFERAFCELWRRPDVGPWELVMFCMHSLRWPEVQRYYERELQRTIAQEDFRAHPIARDIVDSFRDDWEDRDLFPFYDKTTRDA
jgi:hypothetical protein